MRGELIYGEGVAVFGADYKWVKIEPDHKNSNNAVVVKSGNDGIILGGKKIKTFMSYFQRFIYVGRRKSSFLGLCSSWCRILVDILI